MRILAVLLYLLLILIGVSFAVLNAASVTVNFYVVTLKMPISVLMILMLGIGGCIGFLMFGLRYWRLKSECRRLKSKLKLTEQEIKNLRTIPVTDNYTGFGDR
jgi:putative membrane protein